MPNSDIQFPKQVRDAAKSPIELMQQNGASQGTINQGYAAGKTIKNTTK